MTARPPDDLLPGGATALEQELARLSASLDAIDPAVIATVWNAWRCPAQLLPWLAWAMSVDLWGDGWSEIRKREEIDASPLYHRRKGTVWAIERLLDRTGYPYQITEWFDAVPELRRGTGVVHLDCPLADVAALLPTIRPLVMAAKPKSRAIAIGCGPVISGPIVIGAGLLVETLTVIEPYAYAGEDVEGPIVIGAGLLVETLTIIEAA